MRWDHRPLPQATAPPAPPYPPQGTPNETQQPVCKDFQNGMCTRGASCRFKHEAEGPAPTFGGPAGYGAPPSYAAPPGYGAPPPPPQGGAPQYAPPPAYGAPPPAAAPPAAYDYAAAAAPGAGSYADNFLGSL